MKCYHSTAYVNDCSVTNPDASRRSSYFLSLVQTWPVLGLPLGLPPCLKSGSKMYLIQTTVPPPSKRRGKNLQMCSRPASRSILLHLAKPLIVHNPRRRLRSLQTRAPYVTFLLVTGKPCLLIAFSYWLIDSFSTSLQALLAEVKVEAPQIDSSSSKGLFGWETVKDAALPVIFREDERLVPVRIVETKVSDIRIVSIHG